MLYFLESRLIKVGEIIPVRVIGNIEARGIITETGSDFFTVLRPEGGNPKSNMIYEQTLDFNSRINYFPNNPNEFVKITHNPSRIFKPTDHGYKERAEKLRKSGLLD